MRRFLCLLILLLSCVVCIPGCMWVTAGAIAGVVIATDDNDGSTDAAPHLSLVDTAPRVLPGKKVVVRYVVVEDRKTSIDLDVLWEVDGSESPPLPATESTEPVLVGEEIVASGGTRGLAVEADSPQLFVFVWDAQEDIAKLGGPLSQDVIVARLRLTAVAGSTHSNDLVVDSIVIRTDRPRLVNLGVEEYPPGARRATDLSQVQISFDLIEDTGENATVAVEYSVDGAEFRRVPELTVVGAEEERRAPRDLPASAVGEAYTVSWNAAADGFSGLEQVWIRAVAEDFDGPGPVQELRDGPVWIGNDPPVASLEPLGEDGGGAEFVQGLVRVAYHLTDTSGDPADVELEVSSDGGETWETVCGREALGAGGHCSGSQLRNLAAPSDHDSGAEPNHVLFWDTSATFPGMNARTVLVAIRPKDGFPGGDGDAAVIGPLSVENKSPPEIAVDQSGLFRDDAGSVSFAFEVTDGEPSDVLLQWSTGRDSFPDLSLLKDPARRREAILNPDLRASFGLLTPRLRTLVEAQCAGEAGREGDGSYEVFLTHWRAPAPPRADRLIGATLEVLCPSGTPEQTGVVVAADPYRHALRLAEALDPAPAPGQHLRVRESLQTLFLSLATSTTGERYDVAWDVSVDLKPGEQNIPYYIRGTAFRSGWYRQGEPFATFVGAQIDTQRMQLRRRNDPVEVSLNPVSVTSGDMNGDGILDLLTGTTWEDGEIQVFLGRADGGFDEVPSAGDPVDSAPFALRVADLDGDGRLDVIAAERRNGRISVYPGAGDGRLLEPAFRLPTGGGSSSVQVVDIDRDGTLDILTVDKRAGDVVRYYGMEGGGFSGPARTKAGTAPGSAVAADFDRDGVLDLAVASDPEAGFSSRLGVVVYRGAGGRDFFGPSAELLTPVGPNRIVAADFNRDGFTDIVATVSYGRWSVWVFLSRGGMRFEEPRQYAAGGYQGGTTADLNRDGNLDLAVADELLNRVQVLLGSGDGNFSQALTLDTGRSPSHVIARDFDGDLRGDLATAEWQDSQLSVFFGDGEPTFAPGMVAAVDHLPRRAALADVSGDGNLDLINSFFSFNSPGIAVHLGNGDGTFRPAPEVIQTGWAGTVGVGDIDSDGTLDLLAFDDGATHGLPQIGVRFFWGNGDGTFTADDPATGDWLPGRTVFPDTLADLDGNGHLDFVARASGSTGLVVFLGRGGGKFFEGGRVSSRQVEWATAFDLDHDGVLDLVTAEWRPDRLAVYKGEGDGTFGPGQGVEGEVAVGYVTGADFDRDGDIDLVSLGQGALCTFLGRGDGTFAPGQRFEVETEMSAGGPTQVIAADVDRDGFVELATAAMDQGELVIFSGRGDGTFDAPRALAERRLRGTVVLGDLNGDGDPDVVTADGDAPRFSVFLNTTLRPASVVDVAPLRPARPALGDGRGGAIALLAKDGPHWIDTGSGVIDGARSSGYRGRAFHLESLRVEEGAVVNVEGDHPLVLLATGDVDIDGTLDASGRPGEAAGARPGQNRNAGGAGGRGGPGAGSGGAGGGVSPGSRRLEGARGGGPGGGAGGTVGASGQGASGAGGSHAEAVGSGPAGSGERRVVGNARLNPLYGGSGGGGGSVGSGIDGPGGALDLGDAGGGGGGGGGGAVRIVARHVTVRGQILADGGIGGAGREGVSGDGGDGGGGSGGAILLQAERAVRIASGARVSAEGGSGPPRDEGAETVRGSPGRIRLEGAAGEVGVFGRVVPEPSVGVTVGPDGDGDAEPQGGGQIPGDVDADGILSLSDPLGLLAILFSGDAAALPCDGDGLDVGGNRALLDADGNEAVDLSDAVFVLAHLFKGGPPPAGGPECVRIPGCPSVCAPS